MSTTRAEAASERRELESLFERFDPDRGLVRKSGAHGVGHSSPRLAELLLRRGGPGDAAVAARILGCVLDAQVREPAPDPGRFPMLVPETWRDLNGTLFLVSSLVAIAEEHAARLPAPLAARVEDALRRAAPAVEARWQDEVFDVHRDFVAYSNVFALYVQSLALLARHFRDERLRSAAEGQWRRWFNHVSYYGIDEFVSSNYNHVVWKALVRLRSAAPSAESGAEIDRVLEFLLALQYGIHHPVLGLPITGAARDYRRFAAPGGGGFPPIADGTAEAFAPGDLRREFRNRRYPHRASGRAGVTPFRFASWQTAALGLGSMTGGHYFPQQLHLVAAAGRSPRDRAVAFLNAGATLINGWVAQRDGRALCFFARTACSYYAAQLRQRPEGEPAPRTRPPALGLVGPWTVTASEDGALRLRAYGRVLRVTPFEVAGGRARSCRWTEGTAKAGELPVRAFAAGDDAVYAGCVVEWLGRGDRAAPPRVTLRRDARGWTVRESGGLRLVLARLPTGEFVERYDDDWRAQPLLETPVRVYAPGQLTREASRAI